MRQSQSTQNLEEFCTTKYSMMDSQPLESKKIFVDFWKTKSPMREQAHPY